MKKLLWSVAAATLLFASCATDDAEVVTIPASDDFTATINADSRTVLDGTAVLWEADDALTIFTKTAHNRQYKVKSGANTRSATFGYVGYTGSGATKISSNYAIYPYDATATISGDVISTTTASEQLYDATKVDLAHSIMVAKSDDNTLSFKNAGALLRFAVSKEDLPEAYTLKTITLVSANNALAGAATINLANDHKLVVAEDGSKTISLTEINAEITTEAQFFHIALPALDFVADDLAVTFTFEDGTKTFTLPAFELTQNTIKTINYQIKADDFNGSTGEGLSVPVSTPKALQEAVVNPEVSTVVLTADIELTEPLSFGAPLTRAATANEGREFTLDLNGRAISFSDAVQGGAMLTNNGTLIMKNGTVAYEYTGEADTSNSKGNYAIQNNGELAINNVKVTVAVPGKAEGEKFSHALYAVNNAGVFEMDGAESYIYNANNVAMRMWGSDNSAVTVKNGHIKGVRAIWLQLPSSSTTAAPKVSLTVEGGKLEATGEPGDYKLAIYSYNYGNKLDNVNIDVNGGEFVGDIALTGGTNKAQVEKLTINDGLFNGGIYSYAPIDVAVQYVTFNGGRFTDEGKENTKSALFGEGAHFVQTADGYWTVEKLMEKIDENTYAVSTVEGLQWLAEQVNSGENYFEGKTIVLANDIDLNNVEWTPIGSFTKDHGFMGNFDGNNKTIKNLKITSITPDADGCVYAGLFGLTEGVDQANSNFVKNLTIENVTIKSDGDIAAAAIAYPYYTIVENITVKGDINIKGRDYVSGVLAYTRKCVEVKNLTIEGNAGSVIEGRYTVGGVISDIQTNGGLVADYSNFKASGLTIKATKSVGGISGIISGQTLNGATVENVEIVCDNVHKGIVSGSLGDKSTIANLSYSNVTGATAEVGAVYGTGNPVEAKVGDVYYKTSLQDVLANAQAGETVTLIRDIELNASLVLTDEGTLDLNGHSISQKQAQSAAYNMIQNKGNWTIKNGTLDYADVANLTAAVNYVSNTIQNGGSLTLENVKVVNNSDSAVAANGYPHPIDNSGKLVINSGEFTNNANYSSMRIWCTEDTDTEVIINGGTFNGAIDFQTVSAKPNKGTLTINGGTFNPDTYTNAAVRLLGFGVDVDEMHGYIKGGTFNGEVKLNKFVSGEFNSQVFFVSGGKFKYNPSDFLAEGYTSTQEGDYYVVK